MNPKNNRIVPPKDDEWDADDPDTDAVVSSMECTGLIQTPPVSEPEAEAYADLYTIPKPANGNPEDLRNDKKANHGATKDHA